MSLWHSLGVTVLPKKLLIFLSNSVTLCCSAKAFQNIPALQFPGAVNLPVSKSRIRINPKFHLAL